LIQYDSPELTKIHAPNLTPESVTGVAIDSLYQAVSDPTFVKHLVQALVQPVAELVASTAQHALIDAINPLIEHTKYKKL